MPVHLTAHPTSLIASPLSIKASESTTTITLGPSTLIHPFVTLIPPLTVGSHCTFDDFSSIGPGTIGDYVHIQPRAIVRDCVIGNDVSIGAVSTVERCKIGNQCDVGPASSFKDENLPQNTIIYSGSLKRTARDPPDGNAARRQHSDAHIDFLRSSWAAPENGVALLKIDHVSGAVRLS